MDDELMPASALRRTLLALLLPLLLTACGSAWWLERSSFPEDRALARSAIDDLIGGNRVAFARKLPDQIRPQLANQFAPMRQALPFNAVSDVILVDAGFVSMMGGATQRQARLAYEVVSGDRRALVQMVVVRDGKKAVLTAFNVSTIDRPAREINALRLSDMSFANFLVGAMAIAALATTIIAIRRVWQSGLFAWRWLWITGCVFGLFRVSTTWGADQLGFLPVYVTLFSAGAARQGLAPWTIVAGVPVVAIWALLRYRSLKSGAGGG